MKEGLTPLRVPSSNILKLKGYTNSFKNWQRPAPNAGSPFSRNNMQKLFALENHFLRGKKEPNACFLLRAAVVFAAQSMRKKWSWFCWDVARLRQNHVCLSSAQKSSLSPLGSLSAKPTGGWLWSRRAPGGLHHVPQAYPNAMRHTTPSTCNTCTLNPGFVCTRADLSIKILNFWNNPWWQEQQGFSSCTWKIFKYLSY